MHYLESKMARDLNIVFMFSGQGSQYRAMGSELFTYNRAFRSSIEMAESIMMEETGRSLIKEVFYESEKIFDDLIVTHPAIVAIEIAMINVMADMDIVPNVVFGCSLGEFAAAVAAGVWSPQEALKASIEQARIIEQCVVTGGMTAVLSKRTDELTLAMEQSEIFLASDNFNEHFTISGTTINLEKFELLLKKLRITYQRLPIKFPFHTHHVDAARPRNEAHDSKILGSASKAHLYSPLHEKVMFTLTSPGYLWDAIRWPFNCSKVCRAMEDHYGPCLYIDLGPSGTMASFVKYNLSSSNHQSITHPVLTPFKNDLKRLNMLDDMYKSVTS